MDTALDPRSRPEAPRTASATPRLRRVVDAPTRMFHALLGLTFLGAWLTAEVDGWRELHVALGYSVLGLLAWRVLWGLVGPAPSRWAPRLRQVGASLRRWRRGPDVPAAGSLRAQLMAMSVLVLLATLGPLTLSGWATWQEIGGGEVFEELHEVLGNLALALVLLHVGLVAFFSLVERRNLASAMLTGRAAGRGPDLVRRNRAWLAMAMLIAVVGFMAWRWQQAPQGLLSSAVAEHGERHADTQTGDDDDD